MHTKQILSTAVLALAGLLGSGTAQAGHPDLRWSVHIGVPVPPLPHLPTALPRFEAAPVHHHTAWRDRDRDGIADRHDRYDNRHSVCHPRVAPPAWRHRSDRDHDGVPDWRDGRDDRRHHGHRGR